MRLTFAVGSSREFLLWGFAATVYRRNSPQVFALGNCRDFLLWELAANFCFGSLPQLFTVGIYRMFTTDLPPWRTAVTFCHGNFLDV